MESVFATQKRSLNTTSFSRIRAERNEFKRFGEGLSAKNQFIFALTEKARIIHEKNTNQYA